MANKSKREAVFQVLKQSPSALSLAQLNTYAGEIPSRTLRRWATNWVKDGLVRREGQGRATRYIHAQPEPNRAFEFLAVLDQDLKSSLLHQLRDLWTHHSTAIEGNSLTLSDTHFVIEEGLAISGKPLKDHQGVVRHVRAIEFLYQCLSETFNETLLFALHKLVLSGHVADILEPVGAWKCAPNGTHSISKDGTQVFIEHALPQHVAGLMSELFDYVNAIDIENLSIKNAHQYYARIHLGLVHIHPFCAGNGCLARLVANIPLLKAGLPPLVISHGERRAYMQILADYQLNIGQLTLQSTLWPEPKQLEAFESYCESAFLVSKSLVLKAYTQQRQRNGF